MDGDEYPVVAVAAGLDFRSAYELMRKHQVRHLVATDLKGRNRRDCGRRRICLAPRPRCLPPQCRLECPH